MLYTTEDRITLEYKLWAVDIPDGTLSGIVRFDTTKTGGGKLKGMHCKLEWNPQTQIPTLNEDNLFFYGTREELGGLYRRGVPQSMNLESYLDRINGNASQGTTQEYFLIPLNKLMLNESATRFLQESVSHLNTRLPRLVSYLKRVTIMDKQIGSRLCHLPTYFKELVSKARSYYVTNTEELRGAKKRMYEIPDIRMISTPMGGQLRRR